VQFMCIISRQEACMKKQKEYPAINVINVMRGFPAKGLKYQVTPYRMQFPDGKVHVVRNIRRMTTQKVGNYIHYHYVVQSSEQRYFHIVLDTSVLTWKLVQEVDEELFFDQRPQQTNGSNR